MKPEHEGQVSALRKQMDKDDHMLQMLSIETEALLEIAKSLDQIHHTIRESLRLMR